MNRAAAATLVGEKEALRLCREQVPDIGYKRLRRWRQTIPGLHVVLPGGERGHYVVAVLRSVLAAKPNHPS